MGNSQQIKTPIQWKTEDAQENPYSAVDNNEHAQNIQVSQSGGEPVIAHAPEAEPQDQKPEVKTEFQPVISTLCIERYIRQGDIAKYGDIGLATASDSEGDLEENAERLAHEQVLRQRRGTQRAEGHAPPNPSVIRELDRNSVPPGIHNDNASEVPIREARRLSSIPMQNEVPQAEHPDHADEDHQDEMDVESDHAERVRGGGLSAEAISTRLNAVGRAAYDVRDIGSADLKATVTRALMCALYGGGQQTMFPNPSSHRRKNGFDNLGFINRKLNPYAPIRPGHTGLFFVMNPLWTGEMTKRLFVQLGQSKWLYLGLYQFIPVRPLSVVEFRQLDPATRSGWVNHLFSKLWGRQFLIRIALRDENGGVEPSEHQVAAIFADRVVSKSYADRRRVTEQQVMNAFLTGKERLCVSGLKCTAYETQWKRYLIEQGRHSVPQNVAQPRKDIEHGRAGQVPQAGPRPHQKPRRAANMHAPQAAISRNSDHALVARQRLKDAGLGSDSSDLSEIESEDERVPAMEEDRMSEMEVEAMILEVP